jgi:hypothetical protein
MKLVRLLPLLLLLPAFGGPPVLPDASLDGLWFKATIKAKGRAISLDGAEVSKASTTQHAYLHLVLDDAPGDGTPPVTTYVVGLWSEFAPGSWANQNTFNVDVVVTGEDEYVLPDLALEPVGTGSDLVLRATLRLHVKRDPGGAVKSAKLSTLGCEVHQGSLDGDAFYGSAMFTGKMVDVLDLPFIR